MVMPRMRCEYKRSFITTVQVMSGASGDRITPVVLLKQQQQQCVNLSMHSQQLTVNQVQQAKKQSSILLKPMAMTLAQPHVNHHGLSVLPK